MQLVPADHRQGEGQVRVGYKSKVGHVAGLRHWNYTTQTADIYLLDIPFGFFINIWDA